MCHLVIESDSSYKQNIESREESSLEEDLCYVNTLFSYIIIRLLIY